MSLSPESTSDRKNRTRGERLGGSVGSSADCNTHEDKNKSARDWRSLVRDWKIVFSATAVCHALGAVTAVLLRMILSPSQMGIWQTVKLLISQGNYANLGISKGAAREYNVALGSSEIEDARRGLSIALTVNTLTSVAYAALLAGVGIWVAASSITGSVTFASLTSAWLTNPWAIALTVAGILAAVSRYVTFRITILRTEQRFDVTSRIAVAEAVVTLAIVCLCAWIFGLPGVYLGTLAVMATGWVLAVRGSRFSLRAAWDRATASRLVAIGGPILLAGAASSLLRSLDKVMILAYMPDGATALGIYSAALLVAGQLLGLGNMAASVVGPRYGRRYGETQDEAAVAQLAADASGWIAVAMSGLAAISLTAGVPLLARLIPDYAAGLEPLGLLVPGILAMTLSLPGSQSLVAVGRQKTALWCVLIAIALAAGANHFVLTAGYGLTGVAAATSGSFLFYYLLTTASGIWRSLASAGRRRYIFILLAGTIPLLPAVWWRVGIDPLSIPLLTAALQTAITVAVWIVTVGVIYRCAGWQRLFTKQ